MNVIKVAANYLAFLFQFDYYTNFSLQDKVKLNKSTIIYCFSSRSIHIHIKALIQTGIHTKKKSKQKTLLVVCYFAFLKRDA